MARPPIPAGTFGKIRVESAAAGVRARARFRDFDGVLRDVEKTRATERAAVLALKAEFRRRANPGSDDVTRSTSVKELADLWLVEILAEDHLAPSTVHRYRASLRGTILPALGRLRVGDVTVGRLDRILRGVAADTPFAARSVKVVLGQMFSLAVRHGAIPTNPVRDTRRLRRPRHTVAVLDLDGLTHVRAAVRAWRPAGTGLSGPRPTADLADFVDLMLATGARIGEILAIRWSDVNLDADVATLTICGTLVQIPGVGLYRQEWTKSVAGHRTVVLPDFAVATLKTRRRAVDAANTLDAVFVSRRGTWLHPANVRRQWRDARAGTGLEWVTPHTFRKTVATLIDEAVGTRSASLQLGHASETTTTKHYVAKPKVAPDMSGVLQQLAAPV
jgi:integrase